jgi:murein DD-endopeptidase MepM/ murein hydrolase activator NlpD
MVLACFTIATPAIKASAATKSELEDKIDELDDKIAENKKKLNALKNKAESQKEYLETLEDQIETVEQKGISLQTQVKAIDEEIDELNKKLKQLGSEIIIIEEDIEKTKKSIKKTQANIDESSEQLAQRLRAAYMSGNQSTLKILMGADSLASFLTRLEMMKRQSESDKKTIEDFKAKVTKLRNEKTKLEEDKLSLDSKKTELDIKRDEKLEKKNVLTLKQKEYKKTMSDLEKKYAEIETYVSELDKSSKAYQTYIKELEAEKKAADAEINKILEEYYATQNQQSTTLPSGGNANPTTKPSSNGGYNSNASWAWPLGNASCYISSHYGYRDASISGWGFHGGMDIAGGGITGKPVYATRAGKVISAVTSNSGYGIYVLIDHGDGYSSLYAHMSARYVSAGDTVSKGQMVGRVGSTGNVTGPHLHFEIRYYGEKKDPAKFVKKP